MFTSSQKPKTITICAVITKPVQNPSTVTIKMPTYAIQTVSALTHAVKVLVTKHCDSKITQLVQTLKLVKNFQTVFPQPVTDLCSNPDKLS